MPKPERTRFRDGPLGLDNYRQQLGRSFELGAPVEALKRTLVQAGATQRRDRDRQLYDVGLNGLERRAPGDSAAALLQVTCSYRGTNEANAESPLVVRGQIDWGVDGHQCSAYFDWLNGTVIQVAASFVRVIAQVVPYFGGNDEEPSFSETAICTVGATVGYDATVRPPPTFTQQVRMLQTDPPALPAAVLQIPRFARRLWWQGPVPSSAQWAIGPTAAQSLGEVDPLGITQRQPYERPGGASHLLLTGSAGAATLNALVWELVL